MGRRKRGGVWSSLVLQQCPERAEGAGRWGRWGVERGRGEEGGGREEKRGLTTPLSCF